MSETQNIMSTRVLMAQEVVNFDMQDNTNVYLLKKPACFAGFLCGYDIGLLLSAGITKRISWVGAVVNLFHFRCGDVRVNLSGGKRLMTEEFLNAS